MTISHLGEILKWMLDRSPAIDRVFHALGDPTRCSIVDQLSRGPAAVSELSTPSPISLAAVVQHLQVLEASGVVTTEKIGRVRMCRLDPRGLDVIEQWAASRRRAWTERLDRLDSHLAASNPNRPRKKNTTGGIDETGQR